ncbi:transcriptional regulator [Formosa undariae]|uniref:Transcriptional regulator n=1 Tax=Formosa undariae TaxID=1325436 RepID=A0ABV5F177_9FLAO
MKSRYIIILFFLVFSSVYGAQQSQKPDYQYLKKKGNSLIEEGLLEEALLLNFDMVESAKKNNDTYIVSFGYVRMANILCAIGEHSESLRYLDLADGLIDKNKDFDLRIKLLSNYARNYAALKISNKSIEYYNKSIELCKTLPSEYHYFLPSLYINKGDAFLNTPYKLDSTLVYIHKSIKIRENAFKYAVVANYYLKEDRNIDSARTYLNKSKKLIEVNDLRVYHKSIVLQAEANYNKAIGNYLEAISLYEESVVISKSIKRLKNVKLVYKLISQAYSQLQDEDRSHEYLLKYVNLTDSLNTRYNENIGGVISDFLTEQESGYKKQEKKYSALIVTVVFLFVGCIIVIIYYYRKKKSIIIEEKEELINQKELESVKLKQQLNEAFEEVVNLAKANDPSFLIRFQEVYPTVCENLLKVNPKLVNTELIFCAMIWLNFSSKDIASFTHIQPRTVQTKKYRLRKKLNIPEDENIYVWIKRI